MLASVELRWQLEIRGGRSRLTFTNQVSLKSRVAQYCRLRNARLVQYSPLTVLDFFTISPRPYHFENGLVRRRRSLLLCLKPEPLNRPSATKCHAAFAMLQQLQRGDSRARALNTTKDSYAALRVHFQGDRAGAI